MAIFRLGLLSLTILLCSCASMFSKSNDEIKFDSEPPGADVYIKGNKVCKTPCSTLVRRQLQGLPEAMFKLKGYKTKHIDLEKTITKAAFFNIGFISTTFGATSWGIDAATGDMFEYDPKSYLVELDKKKDVSEVKTPGTTFLAINFAKVREDIGRGGGNYLSTYAEQYSTSKNIEAFMTSVRNNASDLLSLDSPSLLNQELSEF